MPQLASYRLIVVVLSVQMACCCVKSFMLLNEYSDPSTHINLPLGALLKYFGAGSQPTPPAPSASATVDDTAGPFSAIPDQYIL